MFHLTLKESFAHLARLEELKTAAMAAVHTVAMRRRATHYDDPDTREGRLVTDDLPYPYSVSTFHQLIIHTGREIARLKNAIKRTNLEAEVPWDDDGRRLSLDEARLEAQRLRDEIALVKHLGTLRSERSEGYNGVRYSRDKDGKQVPEKYRITVETEPTFNTEEMRRRAIQLEKRVARLSSLVEQTEVTAPVAFAPALDAYQTLEEQLAALEEPPQSQ